MNSVATKPKKIIRYDKGVQAPSDDLLAVEEPLEIRLCVNEQSESAAVTMRTPGHDLELAAGFLFAEGVIQDREDLLRLEKSQEKQLSDEERSNRVDVEIGSNSEKALEVLQRSFVISSACGVCGKASLDALELCTTGPLNAQWTVHADVIDSLQTKLKLEQSLFQQTGGLHAAGLFNREGKLQLLREDIGRHNAVDKVIGNALLEQNLPLSEHILMVSGRSSFEILQKAYVAGIHVICSVSAPSSLAVDLAERFNITLIGFLRDGRFNIYTAEDRIRI